MTAGSGSKEAAAGGLARHIPVLGRPVIEFLNVKQGGVYVDATFGAGGHTRDILAVRDTVVIAIDRDPHAIADATEMTRSAEHRLILRERRFSDLKNVAEEAGYGALEGVLFDLGVSSMQLDEAARGFSFRYEGPLDMRMGGAGPTAADVIAAAPERTLARIIALLGEERHARAIARAVVAIRRSEPIRTTRDLAQLVTNVLRPRPGSIHPATRTFQALRIFVNDELGELLRGLAAAEAILKPGGRLVVVSFHSLEDRIVKSFLAERAKTRHASRHLPEVQQAASTFRLLARRPIVPNDDELRANPRARSAKLRAAERTTASASPVRSSGLLPDLPSLADAVGS